MKRPIRINELIGGDVKKIHDWMLCDVCRYGAYWHGFDEKNNPEQRCARCNCVSYRRRATGHISEVMKLVAPKG